MALCQELLAASPYCLKADLILGDIWLLAGKAEAAEVHFGKALALDPEGSMAAALFGSAGRPVPFPVEEPGVDLDALDEEPEQEGAGAGSQEPVSAADDRPEKVSSAADRRDVGQGRPARPRQGEGDRRCWRDSGAAQAETGKQQKGRAPA